jgi:hypothetical protein
MLAALNCLNGFFINDFYHCHDLRVDFDILPIKKHIFITQFAILLCIIFFEAILDTGKTNEMLARKDKWRSVFAIE